MIKKYITIMFMIWCCLLLIFSFESLGYITISYKGFSVDKNENIYIGREKYIDVYTPEGSYIKTISSVTSRGYRFNIAEDNVLRIDTGTELYEIDLNYENETVKETEHQRITGKKEFFSPNGKKYEISNSFFRPKLIVSENNDSKIVFIMPLKDYIIKVLEMFLWLLFVLDVIIIIKVTRTRKPSNTFDGSVCSGES